MARLASVRRAQYAGYQPVFWRPADAGFACEDTLSLATETIGFTEP
jgi:hypothetical protein